MKRILCRPLPRPTTGGEAGPKTSRLPDSLLAEQTQRLALLCGVVGGMWALALVIDLALVPVVWKRAIGVWNVSLDVMGIAVAALVFWYVRYGSDTPHRKADAGLAFLIWNAIGIAVLNTWIVPAVPEQSIRLSWITVGILAYAVIAPAPPRKMLWGALIAASMDPLALALTYLMGNPVATVPQAVLLTLPNFMCALIATLPARVLHRLGRQLVEAQELGSYQLVKLLGRGGMGEVWEGRHRLLARSAAVKLMRPDVLGARTDAEAATVLRRFEREAKATAALSSPHTIHVFDFGVTNEGTFYYVMELLSGRDMQTLVREFGPLQADRVIFLLRQVCHSLADAHARGMVHRDIKPANIYVCRLGLEYDFVKVLDFGLVKMRERAVQNQTFLTLDHSTTGTPAYMAPEIALGNAEVDQRADVYALGCVAYYLLTGQLVFEADTPMKMLMQHVQTQPVPPSQRTELPIPKELDDLVLACLEKDPYKRPQNAEELFQMACDCSFSAWGQTQAKRWWELHLADLTGPLGIEQAPTQHVAEVVAAV